LLAQEGGGVSPRRIEGKKIMARIATGVSKKENRDKLKGLNLFFEWRKKGLVTDFNEVLTPIQEIELAGIVSAKPTTAIEFAVRVAKGKK
jgi:hypothetical protein